MGTRSGRCSMVQRASKSSAFVINAESGEAVCLCKRRYSTTALEKKKKKKKKKTRTEKVQAKGPSWKIVHAACIDCLSDAKDKVMHQSSTNIPCAQYLWELKHSVVGNTRKFKKMEIRFFFVKDMHC